MSFFGRSGGVLPMPEEVLDAIRAVDPDTARRARATADGWAVAR